VLTKGNDIVVYFKLQKTLVASDEHPQTSLPIYGDSAVQYNECTRSKNVIHESGKSDATDPNTNERYNQI